MWASILMFLRGDWKYIVIFLVGQASMIPVIMWFNARNDTVIADQKTEIATLRSSYADAALAAKTDADKQRADSLAAANKVYSDILTGLVQINGQLASRVATVNSNFEALHNDPSFTCLYKPLPVGLLNSLRITSTATASH